MFSRPKAEPLGALPCGICHKETWGASSNSAADPQELGLQEAEDSGPVAGFWLLGKMSLGQEEPSSETLKL